MTRNRLIFCASIVFFLLWILASLSLQHGAFLHPEAHYHLPNYTDGRSVFEKVFNAKFNDFSFYQARELSYAFDFLDANFIKLSFRAGFGHFYSFTHYLFGLLIAILSLSFLRKYRPELPAALQILIPSLFLAFPSFFLWGVFFRSAKIGTALFELRTLLLIYGMYKEAGVSRKRLFGFFVSASVMGLFDRQGFFLQVFFLLPLLFASFEKKYLRPVLYALSAAILGNLFYNYILGPRLVALAAIDRPSFEYQNISVAGALSVDHLRVAMKIFLQELSLFFGSNIWINLIALCVPLLLLWERREEICIRKILYFWAAALYFICGMLFFYSLMLTKHQPLLWPENRLVYYWMPSAVLFMFALFLLPIPKNIWSKAFTVFATALILCGNLWAMREEQGVLSSHYFAPYIQEAPEMRHCLSDKSSAVSTFALNPAGQEICDKLRERFYGP